MTEGAVAVQEVPAADGGGSVGGDGGEGGGGGGGGEAGGEEATVSEVSVKHVCSLRRGGEGAADRGEGEVRLWRAQAHLAHTAAGIREQK